MWWLWCFLIILSAIGIFGAGIMFGRVIESNAREKAAQLKLWAKKEVKKL